MYSKGYSLFFISVPDMLFARGHMEQNVYSTTVDVLQFEDFRLYLKTAVEDLRSRGQFSYRKFSTHAGFSSPNFLLLLIQGERNLSEDGAEKLGSAFGLRHHRLSFFKDLVKFGQSSTPHERFEFSQSLLKFKAKLNIYFIEDEQTEYFKKWIHVAIRELLLIDPTITEDEIAKRMKPTVKKSEVQESLQLLQNLKMIFFKDEKWQVNAKTVSSGSQFVAASAYCYHHQMIELGQKSLERFSKQERYISGSTISLSWDNFKAVQKKISELRSEILALSEIDSNKEEVFQVNFQLFPLTFKKTKKDNL